MNNQQKAAFETVYDNYLAGQDVDSTLTDCAKFMYQAGLEAAQPAQGTQREFVGGHQPVGNAQPTNPPPKNPSGKQGQGKPSNGDLIGWVDACGTFYPSQDSLDKYLPEGRTPIPVYRPAAPTQHPDDVAVDKFAAAMKEKLAQARAKGRGGWEQCDPANLSAMLVEHVTKGDPRDVANFCMFLWNLGQPIVEPAQGQEEVNNSKVICPSCCNQFRAIPVDVQKLMIDAGFEPPFTTTPAAQGQQEASWEHHAKKLVKWRLCMSHNDSYFGEPAGLVKQVTEELDRLIGTTPPAAPDVRELQRDAERYRYLRDNGSGFDISVREEGDEGEEWVTGYPSEELDLAIDAALAKHGGA